MSVNASMLVAVKTVPPPPVTKPGPTPASALAMMSIMQARP